VAINQEILSDFKGGEIFAISSAEPSANQWLLLKGLVLDQNGRLRAQWPGVNWLIAQEVGDDEDPDSSS
jgi:hypothetical protein